MPAASPRPAATAARAARLARRAAALLLAAAAFALAVPAAAAPANAGSGAGASPPAGRLVIVFVPDLGWSDVASAPLLPFARRSAWANVNVRGGTNTRASSYASIGAGAAATAESLDGGRDAREVVPEGTAGDVFERRTGHAADRESVVELDMASVMRLNEERGARPGALGEALRAAGLRTAVWGNADVPGSPERGMVLALADRDGLIATGSVSSATQRPDRAAPFGHAADLDAFSAFWASLPPVEDGGPALVGVEFGDFWRQAAYARFAQADVAARQRESAREALAQLLGTITRELDPRRDGLLLLSPVAREDPRAADYLTPLALWGRGVSPGLLRSPGTRRPGLVTVLDVAPTVLRWFSLAPPPDMTGRPASVVPLSDRATIEGQATPGPEESEPAVGVSASEAPPASAEADEAPSAVRSAINIHERTLNIDRLRPDIIRGWIVAYLLAVAAAGVRLVTARRPLGSLAQVLAYLAALGPGFLLAVAFPWAPWTGLSVGFVDVALAALLLVAVSAWLGQRVWRSPEGTLFALALITAALITFDAARGGFWTRWSYLGYSALSGARYYGIGNELMGVWLGAVFVGTAGILERWGRRGLAVVALLMLSCVALLAWPDGGANFGGATAAVVAMVPAFLAAWRGRLRLRDLLWAALGLAAVVAGMAGADLAFNSGHMSHVGRLAREVLAVGPAPLVDVAVRKLLLEWHLILLTIWTKLLAVFVASAAMLVLWAPEPIQRLWRDRPGLRAGAIGFGIAILAVIALNDSGVVAAATMLTMAAAAFFAGVSAELGSGDGRAR